MRKPICIPPMLKSMHTGAAVRLSVRLQHMDLSSYPLRSNLRTLVIRLWSTLLSAVRADRCSRWRTCRSLIWAADVWLRGHQFPAIHRAALLSSTTNTRPLLTATAQPAVSGCFCLNPLLSLLTGTLWPHTPLSWRSWTFGSIMWATWAAV